MNKRISILEAIPKIRHFCNYRERCHKEVRDKLYAMGLWKADVDQAIMQMMDENLLNEERYAKSYARGHFYHKDCILLWYNEHTTCPLCRSDDTTYPHANFP